VELDVDGDGTIDFSIREGQALNVFNPANFVPLTPAVRQTNITAIGAAPRARRIDQPAAARIHGMGDVHRRRSEEGTGFLNVPKP